MVTASTPHPMQTTLTLQSTLAFLGGIAGGALISISAATAISSLMLITTAKPTQACLATIPTESAAGSDRPHHAIGCGIKPF